MKKIGIFVEGQTERIFVEKLLGEYLSFANLKIEARQLIGDNVRTLYTKGVQDPECYVLIVDAENDERALSSLLDRAETMILREQFNCLMSLRDIFPAQKQDKQLILSNANRLFAKFSFAQKLKLILAVEEVEAWFLADYNVTTKIDASLTPEVIKQAIQVDLINDDPEDYRHPAVILKKIMQIVGKSYSKKEDEVYYITSRIDYSFLCLATKPKIASFHYFIQCIDQGLA